MRRDAAPRTITRRRALSTLAAGVAGASLSRLSPAETRAEPELLRVDPTPRHALSPYLYMQFMEPLGATDGSVEAAWDHLRDSWRPDVIAATRELAPTLMRWGGIFTDYYRWREGVGPREERPQMLNLLWGGVESNQVGTAEFVDFCRQVEADPLICVNFESDGRKRFMEAKGRIRTADASEAAEWVAYCNRETHPLRSAHGLEQPLRVGLWQLGNETSYDERGFDLETAARKTVEFARRMREADPGIQLIGWGDQGWAPRMIEVAGEHLQYVAFHHMFDPDDPKRPVLRDQEYRKDPDRTWHQLMQAVAKHEGKIRAVRETLPDGRIPLAMTECHFSIPGRDRCDVLSTWAAGVSYARMLNLHERHGDVLKIATAADFCGSRWQVNAVMIPTPAHQGDAFLMPVARVMALYRRHGGEAHVSVPSAPDGLDVTASRTADQVVLHVVNTHRTRPVRCRLDVIGRPIRSGRVFEIAAPPEMETTHLNPRALEPRTKALPEGARWEFPAASVSAIELDCAAEAPGPS